MTGASPGGKQVTIYDVAAAAGVAPSTVSRALSKPGRVSFRTAEHVRQVAAELGYRTESRQRSTFGEPSRLLAMVVADITNPVFYGMIRGAERTARHEGYELLLVETQESREVEQSLLERLGSVADGIILTSSRLSDTQILAVTKKVPLVVLNRLVHQVPSVVTDNRQATTRAAGHLAGLGHRRITYLAGPEASWVDGARWRGLVEAGRQLDLGLRRTGPHLPTPAGGREAAAVWLDHPTSSVVAYNDLIAIGFIQALHEAGVDVPGQVSVVGFDNIRDSELVTPQLTTVAAPLVSLGSAAVRHLLKIAMLPTRTDESVVLPARLVVRASTGPAAGWLSGLSLSSRLGK
ncbi:MAG: LacI family DNA-binding transcriptional regulator [Microlunatus sp.]